MIKRNLRKNQLKSKKKLVDKLIVPLSFQNRRLKIGKISAHVPLSFQFGKIRVGKIKGPLLYTVLLTCTSPFSISDIIHVFDLNVFTVSVCSALKALN